MRSADKDKRQPAAKRRNWLWRLAVCAMSLACASGAVAAVPPGVWLMGTKVAVQIFDCSGLLCGRVVWLKAPLDPEGLLKRDKLNPDPALRERQVCGPTIIWGLSATAPGHWEGGWFYNPDDGTTYSVKLELQSADVIAARIYRGIPLIGQTRRLLRVPMGTSAGWC